MARRKKRATAARSERRTSCPEKAPFNPVIKAPGALEASAKPDSPRPKAVAPAELPNAAEPPEAPGDEENRIFLEAVADVAPLPGNRLMPPPDPDPRRRPDHPANLDELEAMAHLCDLIHGAAEWDITFSDEYIEGSVPGIHPRLMRRLKRGHFPIQAHLDLHGLTKTRAEERVREFLLHCYRRGLRCVLVVHGRGLNSQNHIPVLKERLPVWLNRGPVKRIVLAFSTARPYDGGTGAIYVLLRRRK